MVSYKLLIVTAGVLIVVNLIVVTILLTPVRPELQPLEWWQNCVLYQIYVRSFKDSDGDGIGDLRGVITKMDHLEDAGVTAIVLSPVFVSPMVDFGYDVTDYYNIDPQYGTLGIFDELLRQAHRRDIKVILDIPVNHASTKSNYFIRSEEGLFLEEHFFIWGDPLVDPDNSSNRLPPSNWESQYGGSAWEWNEKRQQYYLHQFDVEQADFNFRHPFVVMEIENVLLFWLSRGVDGVRLGALPYLIEANPSQHGERYPDNPEDGSQTFNRDHPELYHDVYSWRNFIDTVYSKRILIAEAYTNEANTMLYYGNHGEIFGTFRPGAHFPYNFNLITSLSSRSRAWDWSTAIDRWMRNMPLVGGGAVPNWVSGNHDNSRVASRFRDNMVDGINALVMLLPGVAVSYQGEEIGMRDGYVSWEDTKDVSALNRGEETYLQHSRDPARTPYHWDQSTSAGFSTNENTWLPVADDFTEINLAKQQQDTKSHYKVYQALTALRKEPTFSHGDYNSLNIWAMTSNTFCVVRMLSGYDTYTLIFNVSEFFDTVNLNTIWELRLPATIDISSAHSWRNSGDTIAEDSLILAPGEMLVVRSRPRS